MENLTFTKEYCQNILKQNKLILVCDIDETLLTTIFVKDPVAQERLKDIYYRATFDCFSYQGFCSKFRPHLTEFLTKISEKFELHVMSAGSDIYVRSLVDIIDPKKSFFGNRITTKNGIADGASKLETLQRQFDQLDNIVCVIDDRIDVWNYNDRVVQVKPYKVLDKVNEINNSAYYGSNYSRKSAVQDILENLIDSDNYLQNLQITLESIHRKYFQSINEEVIKSNYENITGENLSKMENVMCKMRMRKTLK